MMDLSKLFPRGILRPELFMGKVSAVNSNILWIDFSGSDAPSASQYRGKRYGKGEVGEFVLVEGQTKLIFGRVVEVRHFEEKTGQKLVDAVGKVQLLGSVSMDELKIIAGVSAYPRLNDRVYAAPYDFISHIPVLMEDDEAKVTLCLGSVGKGAPCDVNVRPEKLFGRHLAILGSTGGGKSWTMSRIIGECLKFDSKMILIDATGEYHEMTSDERCLSVYLNEPVGKKNQDNNEKKRPKKCSLPPSSFQESDFIALFEPAGRVQGPKMKEAIRSLRLASLCPEISNEQGYIEKIGRSKKIYMDAVSKEKNSSRMDNPSQFFDVSNLSKQIEQECAREYDDKWGKDDGSYKFCLSLITRISGIMGSPALSCVFKDTENPLDKKIENFITDNNHRLLRIDLSGVPFEYKAREVISNVIGRFLLCKARKGDFTECPLLIFLDEAHNFLGKHIGGEDTYAKLDAFELIAKEGRKFGLNICLSSQRPRDITEGVLSQMGTMVVHRLTNDRDREIVERACGEIDRMASSFLPSLQQGEATIIGNDFPIPLTVQIKRPEVEPDSSGPDYQRCWGKLSS